MRVKSMQRTRQALDKLQLPTAAGKLNQPEKIDPEASDCCSGAMATATIPGSYTRGACGTSRTRQTWGAKGDRN